MILLTFIFYTTLLSFITMMSVLKPLPLALGLIMIAIFLGLLSWMWVAKWVGVSLTLIYLGGMMVIFLYVSFLSSNFKFLKNSYNKLVFIMLFLLCFFSIQTPMLVLKDLLISETYMNQTSETLIFLISYLLLTLLAVVKFSQCFKGALVKKF